MIEASPKERKWNWKDSHLVFIVLPIVLILLIPFGGLLYIYGRLSLHPIFLICMVYPPIGVFIIYCLITGVVRLTRGWRGDMKFLLFTQILLPLAFVISAVIMPPVLVKSPLWPDATPFTYGFRDRIESKADIRAIRVWLKTLNTEDYAEPGDRVPQDEWPKSLKVLSPGIVYVMVDKNGVLQARFTWGGAVFHWGLTIGMEDFQIPKSELNDRYEAWLLVEPGVYVYDW